MNKALIVVDVQNDFSSTGAVPVKGGEEVVPVINRLMASKGWGVEPFGRIILTQDWHPEGHTSFGEWPRHCVQGSNGAQFIRGLDTDRAHMIVRKGTSIGMDSYSAFVENDKRSVTGLAGYLGATGANEVFVCGLALDYCVLWTAIDSKNGGRKTTVILDACRGVLPETIKEAQTKMAELGIGMVLSTEVV